MATLNFTCQMLQGSLYAQLAQNTVASDGWRYTNRMAALGCAVLAAITSLLVWHTPEEVGCTPDGAPAPAPPASLYAASSDDEASGKRAGGDEGSMATLPILHSKALYTGWSKTFMNL